MKSAAAGEMGVTGVATNPSSLILSIGIGYPGAVAAAAGAYDGFVGGGGRCGFWSFKGIS